VGTRMDSEPRCPACETPSALILAAEPVTHSMHKWTGSLNVPYEISIQNSRD